MISPEILIFEIITPRYWCNVKFVMNPGGHFQEAFEYGLFPVVEEMIGIDVLKVMHVII